MRPVPTPRFASLPRAFRYRILSLALLSLTATAFAQNPPQQPPQNQQGQKPESGQGNRAAQGGPNRSPQGNAANSRPAQQARPGPGHQPANTGRQAAGPPANVGRPAARPPAGPRPNYQFRAQDRSRMLSQYRRSLAAINRARRPRFVRGGYFAGSLLPYFTPAPPALSRYLPPVPPGYALGYYQGYVVVYDPATFFILNLVDLLS
jgi:hypothetical protein